VLIAATDPLGFDAAFLLDRDPFFALFLFFMAAPSFWSA